MRERNSSPPEWKRLPVGAEVAPEGGVHFRVWAPRAARADAWLRAHPEDRVGTRKLLEAFGPHLDEAGVGSISEIFDAEPPFTPRGCIAQGWSVAEVLRALILTAGPGPSDLLGPRQGGQP